MNPPETFGNKTPAERPALAQTPPGPPRGVATMAILRWVLVVMTGLVAMGSILSFAGAHLGSVESVSSSRVYYCPMHPSVVRDHPGECPICSMTLVLKTEGKANPAAPGEAGKAPAGPPTSGVPGLAEIDLTPQRIQLIGMRTATVKREAIGGELRAFAVVAGNERGPAHINPRFGGTQVWVTADIYEQDISRVRVGQRARLELAAYPGETQTGKVTFISPLLDADSRTLRLRLEFTNTLGPSGPRLRPGMSGTVYLELPSTTGLTVPAEAVVDTGEMRTLFVAKDGGRFEPRVVEVGAHLKDEVEIRSGVAEGETVVTTGNFLVDSESRLRAAIEGQTSPERR